MNHKAVNAVLAASKAWLAAQEKKRHIQLQEAKLRESESKRILYEAQIAHMNNAVVLQDLQIEIKKLELELLEKRAHPPKFNPDEP